MGSANDCTEVCLEFCEESSLEILGQSCLQIRASRDDQKYVSRTLTFTVDCTSLVF